MPVGLGKQNKEKGGQLLANKEVKGGGIKRSGGKSHKPR